SHRRNHGAPRHTEIYRHHGKPHAPNPADRQPQHGRHRTLRQTHQRRNQRSTNSTKHGKNNLHRPNQSTQRHRHQPQHHHDPRIPQRHGEIKHTRHTGFQLVFFNLSINTTIPSRINTTQHKSTYITTI